MSSTARESPHNRKSIRTDSPETKKQQKRTESSKCEGQKSMQFDDRGKTDEFFRAVHAYDVFNTTVTTWTLQKEPQSK